MHAMDVHSAALPGHHACECSCVRVCVFDCVIASAHLRQFLAKSQMESINELFTNELNPDWTFPRSSADSVPLALLLYTLARFGFLVVGVTLPFPCGVFAPCLAVGAGIGRGVNEFMQSWQFGDAYDCNAGGYAVLGAAAMAAGTTRTISSAILMCDKPLAPLCAPTHPSPGSLAQPPSPCTPSNPPSPHTCRHSSASSSPAA